VLFGKLKGGGSRPGVVLVKDEAGRRSGGGKRSASNSSEGPVHAPKPEKKKLPGNAQSARCRGKPKPSGPSGGSKGPASRGPLVKVVKKSRYEQSRKPGVCREDRRASFLLARYPGWAHDPK